MVSVRLKYLSLISSAALVFNGCTPDFQSQSQVIDLRILGIKAEPPEALFNASCTDMTKLSTCTVSSVDDMRITALFADPAHPAHPGVISPTLCPPQTNQTPSNPNCGPGSLELMQQHGAQDQISFSLQGALTAADLQQLPALLIASAQASPLMGYGGLQVELQLGVDTADPFGVQLGHKTLVFNPRTADGNPNRNHNPSITGMKLLDQMGHDLGARAPGEPLLLTLHQEIGLRPVLAAGSIETYQTIDLTGARVTVRENLAWDFYSTANADFDKGSASEPLAGVADPLEGLTRFTAIKQATGTLWAVVHDGRGGTDWIQIPWTASASADAGTP